MRTAARVTTYSAGLVAVVAASWILLTRPAPVADAQVGIAAGLALLMGGIGAMAGAQARA